MMEAISNADSNVYDANGITLYGSYEELVRKARERLAQEVEAMAWTRWALGAHVKALLEEAKYGDHKVEDLEKDLELSKKTLYACKTLFETFTRQEMVDKIAPMKLSFRALNYLARVADPDRRDEYMGQLSEGKIKAEEIPSLEREIKNKDKDTNPTVSGSKRVAALTGKLKTLLDKVIDEVPYIEEAVNLLYDVAADSDEYDQAINSFGDLMMSVKDSKDMLDSLMGELVDIVP